MGEETTLGEDFLGEKLANTKIFSEDLQEEAALGSFSGRGKRNGSISIIGTGNTVFGDEAELSGSGEGTGSGGGAGETNRNSNINIPDPELDPDELMGEEFPFSERDIAPEPFLWDREPKCHHVA